MISRSLRKLAALSAIIVGVMLVRGLVDATPVIGSPQIDYPGFDRSLPFWPQQILAFGVMGAGGSLVAALGMLAWEDEGIPAPNLRRIAQIGAMTFSLAAGLQLALFLALGTMGPLNTQQPILRFALTIGLASGLVIVTAWIFAAWMLGRRRSRTQGPSRFFVPVATMCMALMAFVVVTALFAGLPLLPVAAFWWPAIPIFAVPAALLVALILRPEVSG